MASFPYKILLGSQSPRRSYLLSEMGIPFDKEVRSIDEDFDPNMDVYEVAEFLAHLKAQAFDGHLSDDQLLITADSVVIKDGVIYGKPKDAADAKAMLDTISGGHHTVVTGVCFKTTKKEITISDKSIVHMSPMSAAELDYYVDHGSPLDKAGSYGIQEWIGYAKIQRIDGSYANIMGLPTHRVYEVLVNDFGFSL